ncbi:hypothetical protein [Streptacidiphilus jiangxiensis]|uniref:Uncharacterized protein n=1 Tax=Streptacidiphilus jiangxiensis TaxID=235985 RepID=A0A1H7PB67_STRJI|nr:hypothetical protein [Streptacidiphilus jiangxiensis]SEL33050.1 hypothetical protein SAMN05414137_107305 [Streptacidiphilus jiangxiensis]
MIQTPAKPDLRTRWDRLTRPKKIATGAAAAIFIPSFLVGTGQGLGQAVTGYKQPTPTVTVTVTATVHTTVTVTAAPRPTLSKKPAKPTPKPSPTVSAASATAASTSASDSSGTTASNGYPVLLSPSGRYYHAGEFCPHADDGVTTVDSGGTPITCSDVNGYFRWHY